MILSRRFHTAVAVLWLAPLLGGCGNETARAPVPTAYDWPDAMGYWTASVRLSERGTRTVAPFSKADTQTVAAFSETKTIRFAVRDDGSYAVSQDDVTKMVALSRSRSTDVPLLPEDTLHYFARLSRWGEFLALVPACDPAVPACHDAPPSALPLELRHLIPRLPVWWPPRGHAWADTLSFDDLPRARGLRGTVTAVYRVARDAKVRGETYWVVTWRSIRRVDREATGGAIVAEAPEEETGTVYIDKRLLIPAYAEWRGTAAPPPELRSLGATRTEIRGHAVLVGSPFVPVPFTQEAR